MNALVTVVASTILAAGITATGASAQASTPTLHSNVRLAVNTPCDGPPVNCYWNADDYGDGHGESFYRFRINRSHVCVMFWDRAYNARHGYCARG